MIRTRRARASRPARPRLPALLVAAGVTALACGGEETAPAAGPPPVMVERATAHRVRDRIEATGEIRARAEATVAAQVGGEITGVAADEGAAVERAQIVVEIDPERRQLELENARARLVQAEAELARARREAARIGHLAERGVASQARLDEALTQRDLARSGRAAAQAEVGLAERALADASVGAPFAGLIGRRHVNVGEFVNPGQPLFELVALDPVEVEFHLAEADSARVALGQSVEVRVASHPDRVYPAEVSVVAPTIDPQTRTRRVKALLPNPEGALLPGTFARVDLGVAERSRVVMVPKEAILQRADGSVVYRLKDAERVERVRVVTGPHRGARVEIREGLAAGDWVVVRGQTGLIDGARVSLRRADGSPFDAAELDAPVPGTAPPGGRGG